MSRGREIRENGEATSHAFYGRVAEQERARTQQPPTEPAVLASPFWRAASRDAVAEAAAARVHDSP